MALTNAGRDFIAKAIINSGSPVFFDNSGAFIGVGESSVAFAAAQTALQGVTPTRKGMSVGFPTIAGNVLTFQALFGTSDANIAWSEWGLFNGAAGGTMLNRKVENLGTKTSAQSWQFTVDITVNAV